MSYLKHASSRFYKYLFSYVLILTLVLAFFGSIVYGSLLTAVRKDIEANYIDSLVQIQRVLDNRFVELYRVALEISENPILSKRQLHNSGYDVYLGVQELRKYNTNNAYFDEIALYFLGDPDEKIYTSSYDSDLSLFFNRLNAYSNWNEEQFKNDVGKLQSPTTRPLENVRILNISDKKYMTHIYPIPIYSTKPNAVIMFLVDESVYKEMFANICEKNKGFAFVFDENKKLLVSISDNQPDDISSHLLKNINLSSDKSIDKIKYKGIEYSVVKHVSPYNNYTYVAASPTQIYMSQFWAQRNVFYISIFIIFLVGAAISLMLALSAYKPLKELANTFKEYNSENEKDADKDEFEVISNLFRNVSAENKDLVDKLNNDQSVLQNIFILKLLRGKLKNEQKIADVAQNVGVKLPYNSCCTAIIYFDQYKDETDKDRENFDLIKYAIRNVSEEMAASIGICHTVELENGRSMAMLFNFDTKHEIRSQIERLAFALKEFFKSNFEITITVGIGGIVNSIMNAGVSFSQAERSVNYRLLKGNDSIISFEDIKNHDNQMYSYPAELESDLILAIKTGDSDKVRSVTSNIQNYILNNIASPKSARIVCIGIINSLLKAVEDMNLSANNTLYAGTGSLIMDEFETVNSLVERITDFCLEICKDIEVSKESKNVKLREMALSVINNELTNPNLTLEYIASKCSVSPSYLSRYFKDQTGTTLIQYINTLRIEKVKTLLKETDLSIRDILLQVGYFDESNFIRKFKKSEGITPIQYRNIARESLNKN
ncbi:MAG: AraC family transcriptional regulator [Bacillota bacterium]|nr:AraC family transcriptional regulator [Bacillota bacterium]